ncbi:helix-turn-helix transcriptional regulator [Aquisalimonas lutea]|uniref:helix-turn-helix domain-containing protein n=1 Tax=Aquisalimonas lutea TaxID=1327750 RepID=UPI0025B58656|nr:helix-turn-helix transcriptional regulator [Aquisalimonas lutea]MDN3519621.1 helix-turn-helix transcriptional regulator [Aquisalimonas lutea]
MSKESSLAVVAARIRGARAILRLSQKDLASLSGVSHPQINRIERQEASARMVTIEAIEQALTDLGIRFGAEDEQGQHAIYFAQQVVDRLTDNKRPEKQ